MLQLKLQRKGTLFGVLNSSSSLYLSLCLYPSPSLYLAYLVLQIGDLHSLVHIKDASRITPRRSCSRIISVITSLIYDGRICRFHFWHARALFGALKAMCTITGRRAFHVLHIILDLCDFHGNHLSFSFSVLVSYIIGFTIIFVLDELSLFRRSPQRG